MKPPTYMEIDITQLRSNYMTVKSHLLDGVKSIGVVKSDAYGHGLVNIARSLEVSGCEMLGAGSADDALRLRSAGIKIPILIIYPVQMHKIDALVHADIDMTVTRHEDIVSIQNVAKNIKKIARLHLQIDTGMHHYGCTPEESASLAKSIDHSSTTILAGISTHYASAGNDINLANKQHQVFKKALALIAQTGSKPLSIHAANSSAVDQFPESYSDPDYSSIFPTAEIYIRIGCLLYGTYSSKNESLKVKGILKSLKSHIVELKAIDKSETVGYFNNFQASSAMNIAILPVGWGTNGYFPYRGSVSINGHRVPIVGPIGANTLTIDVSNVNASINDTVTLLGKDEDTVIDINDLAKMLNTFPNRAISLVSASTQKIYIDE